MRAAAVLIAGIGIACNDPGPACTDIRFSPLTVDVDKQITFFWQGSPAQNFAVIDRAGRPMWELLCACPLDRNGEETCRTAEDWDFMACLEGPIVYGELPDTTALSETRSVALEARELATGFTYTALIWSVCDIDWGRQETEARDFVAP